MRGHVAKKGARYYPVVDLGMQPAQRCLACRKRFWASKGRFAHCPRCGDQLTETSERRQQWHDGHDRKKDALIALTALLQKLDQGSYVGPSKQSLGEFLEEWLPAMRSTVRPSTWDSYRMNVEKHIVPRLGSLQLRRISPTHLNGFYADLLENGRRDGAGLSPRTVRYIHTILRKALKDAVRWDRVERNIADLADPPKQSQPDMKTWSALELRHFLNRAKDDRLYGCYLLAATTGMRRGELLGLRWGDVNLDQERLHVRQTYVVVNYRPAFSKPKTNRSARSIALDSATVAALRAHRARQSAERLAWGTAYEDSGLVFTRENGAPIHPQALSDAFARLGRRAELPPIRFHDLRHTYATVALAGGVHPKVVSDRLGHSSIAVTLDRYSHVVESVGEEAAAKIASLILGS